MPRVEPDGCVDVNLDTCASLRLHARVSRAKLAEAKEDAHYTAYSPSHKQSQNNLTTVLAGRREVANTSLSLDHWKQTEEGQFVDFA